ncbi:MAG: tagaturonate epimerase family protein, partial [Treponema sp.]|nr:tagaturonate epimerase family protein [Treponema sp.]
MDYLGFDAYEKSIQTTGSSVVFMAREVDETVIICAPQEAGGTSDFSIALGFTGQDLGGGRLRVPLTHENAEVLRKRFPFTAPVRGLTRDRSFGVGDRLGIATPGHIRVFEACDVFPFFAQQSIRELNLTGRTYEDVLDAVSFAVFREGFTKGFGADGDHLKTVEDVEYALSLGFSMITLDCSDYIKSGTAEPALPLSQAYRDKYLKQPFSLGEGITLSFTEQELQQSITVYGDAIGFARDMYTRFFQHSQYEADFEISIDETATPTTPLQHFFVARELRDAGVAFATLAPRFCGSFQKGIDYRGDVAQFEADMQVHGVIARYFGYKLSIHSGSDKFRVFPSISRETRGVFHVKTAGTNWLEAMRVVALVDPSLYREIHHYALSVFGEAAAYYHVTPDLTRIPEVDALNDEEVPGLLDDEDARQLIHISYGLILNKKNPDGTSTFKDRLYRLWKDHEELYAEKLASHIRKHLTLLGV